MEEGGEMTLQRAKRTCKERNMYGKRKKGEESHFPFLLEKGKAKGKELSVW